MGERRQPSRRGGYAGGRVAYRVSHVARHEGTLEQPLYSRAGAAPPHLAPPPRDMPLPAADSARAHAPHARTRSERALGDQRQMAIEGGTPARGAGAAPAAGTAPDGVHVITLQHGEHHDSTLYRFDKGCRVQFQPGPSLLGRRVFLYTNYVVSDNQEESEQAEFVRSQYCGLEWRRRGDAGGGAGEPLGESLGESLGAGLLVDDSDAVAELRLARAGTFHYYFVYDTASCPLGPQGSGWLQVAPTLLVPLDAVCCQTVLGKCLGPLARWRGALRVAREAGYNMLHFTPLQALGASGSSYSIADQLRLDARYGPDASFADVGNLLAGLRAEWGMMSISDVVLNHTANESPWLREHPEATYNVLQCAHLRPAALLDALLARLSADVAHGRVPDAPPCLVAPDQLQAVLREAGRRVAAARLHELFQCDRDQMLRRFRELAGARLPAAPPTTPPAALALLPDPARRRLAATVDMELALQLYNVHSESGAGESEEARLSRCCERLARALDALNEAAAADCADHLRAALDNVHAGMRYERLQADGPRLGEVSARAPLAPPYFTLPPELLEAAPERLEAALWGAAGAGVAAHNGWVMDADPLEDFAAAPAGGRVYLRRELLAWGDSVKLRYGARPEDCPALWARMRDYVELTAELFDGLRLDNCHSTPLHVAEYMVDAARNVKPDLYVVAELFTNSDHVDNIYVNRLGVTSLVREALSAWDAHEQGRLVHRFGGRAVGAFLRAPRRPAAPRVAHAILMDLTHDNPSPLDKRSVFDMLPSAALVAMACCATGSTRGYDELVPHQVHVVDEERLYCAWSEEPGEGRMCGGAGLLAAKRALNALHQELAAQGYEEVFVDQMDPDVVAVTRHHPRTRQSVVLVAVTAFRAPDEAAPTRAPRDLRVEGELQEILLEAALRRVPGAAPHAPHSRYVTGLGGFACELRQRVPLAQSGVLAGARRDGDATVLQFRALAPGTVVALRVAPGARAAAALHALHGAADALAAGADALALAPALADLDLTDLNALLYRCEAEERDASGGASGAYDVPGHGPLVYAGLQGAASLFAQVRAADDLGHALCANLRAGDWLADYTWRRLEREPRLRAAAACARAAFALLEGLPRFLRPAYVELLHSALHGAARRAALRRLAPACRRGPFARGLALTSVQLTGRLPSAPLPLAGARAASLAAGLPHFAAGYMRCWGRDTFVALRGLYLCTARWSDARAHILAFAACLRHGLVPNLLDGGARARYNCRDAVWWWLESVQQYCALAPQGAALLAEPVARLFASVDAEPGVGAATQPLHDVMQEALDAHFQGRAFRERRAGPELDAHMSERGFLVQVGVHPETGFPFGGNDANCGTWMDKMGSSERAGTRGRPATPRDGSAVELVALAYSAVAWLAREHRAGRYPHAGVSRDGLRWGWAEWAARVRRAFERHFWVPERPAAGDARPDLVHRRAIYKDSHGASQPWADYQLRCNFVVAMAVAPELFEPRHALLALDAAERLLLGPLGLKTLDPDDWNYRAEYDNDDDSADPSVAHGFNYHQGPEWTWPLGFYLRARLAFALHAESPARVLGAALRALAPAAAALRASPWRGLPELTGPGGAACAGSCATQAWSSAAALDALLALRAARAAD